MLLLEEQCLSRLLFSSLMMSSICDCVFNISKVPRGVLRLGKSVSLSCVNCRVFICCMLIKLFQTGEGKSTKKCSDSPAAFHFRLCYFLLLRQTGEPGGEAEGMGSQESAGGRGEARLLHGALPRPRDPTGSQSRQQHAARCQWQHCQRLLQVPVPDESLNLRS